MFVLMFTLLLAWTEDFETQAYFPPNNWMIVNEDALDAVWYRVDCQAHSGVKAAVCYFDTSYTGLSHTNLDYLITPRVLPIGADTLLSFWAVSTTPAGCSLDIMVCTQSIPNMASLTVLDTYIITSLSWTQYTLSLNSYTGIPVYVAFRARGIPIHEGVGVDDITLPNTTSQPSACNGRLRTKGPPSQKYLQVWGTNYEMGYAHGYLLAEEIIAAYINKWIGTTSFHSISPAGYENIYLPFFRNKYYVPQKFQDEVQGMHDGIIAKGVSLFHPALGRDLTAEDLLCMTAGGDEKTFGCSSLSGWGQSTINDDTLQGGYLIARNVDGRVGLYTTLGNISLIIAYDPSDPNEQRFFNVSMAGIFGAFSCLNANGVGLCQNTGNHPDTNAIPPNSLIGDFLSSRLAIELIDPDGSGINDIYDIDSMKVHSEHIRSNDIHLYSLYDGSHPTPGAALEINHLADTMRFATHNSIPPQIYSSWNLAVTNHDRLLYPPTGCWRYQTLVDSLNSNFQLNTQRIMRIANTVAAGYNFSTSHCTYHTMIIKPNVAIEHPDWPSIGVSYARCNRGAHTQGRVWYSWDELFEGVPGIEEGVVKPIKKTARIPTVFAGRLQLPGNLQYRIFDITGRQVYSDHLTPGIYFIEVDGKIIQKLVKIK